MLALGGRGTLDREGRGRLDRQSEQPIQLGGRDRRAEQEALHLGAALGPQLRELLHGLDALGGNANAEFAREVDRGPDDGQRIAFLPKVAHEGFVDLQLVERKASEVAERRVAGAEIV